MGSGRGDRNQSGGWDVEVDRDKGLQWGPVVVTGIRGPDERRGDARCVLQWGPVVVTGISADEVADAEVVAGASMGSGRGDRNQEYVEQHAPEAVPASMGSGRGDRNQRWAERSGASPTRCCFNGVRSW